MPIALRGFLLLLLAVGLVGTAAELMLLEHTETVMQWVPLVMIVVALMASGAIAFRPTRSKLWLFRGVMGLMVLTGALGLMQHYQGNMEFELEMRPSMEGLELFRESMMGATPALAPGVMAHLGLLGLALAYRYPVRKQQIPDEPEA